MRGGPCRGSFRCGIPIGSRDGGSCASMRRVVRLSIVFCSGGVGVRLVFWSVCGGSAQSFRFRTLRQLSVQSVRVVGLVSDQPGRKFVEEAGGDGIFDEMALCRRSAFHSNGEWKTVTSGDSDDLRALPAASRPDRKAPFLALANVASTKASSRLSLPCSCNNRARSLRASINFPSLIHCWNRRWQV